MKRFSLLTIVLFLCAASFAQTQSEKEIRGMLAHKWKPTHLEEDGQKMPAPAEANDWFYDMKADGTYILLDSEGLKKGKWSYDHKTKKIIASNEIDPLDPWKFEVTKVSETELVLKVTEEGMTMKMYMKRVN